MREFEEQTGAMTVLIVKHDFIYRSTNDEVGQKWNIFSRNLLLDFE